jgi:hypothetical protein
MLAQRLLAVPERVGAAPLMLGWKGGAREAQAEFIREGMWPRTVAKENPAGVTYQPNIKLRCVCCIPQEIG